MLRRTEQPLRKGVLFIRGVSRGILLQFKDWCGRRGSTLTLEVEKFMRVCLANDGEIPQHRDAESIYHYPKPGYWAAGTPADACVLHLRRLDDDVKSKFSGFCAGKGKTMSGMVRAWMKQLMARHRAKGRMRRVHSGSTEEVADPLP